MVNSEIKRVHMHVLLTNFAEKLKIRQRVTAPKVANGELFYRLLDFVSGLKAMHFPANGLMKVFPNILLKLIYNYI